MSYRHTKNYDKQHVTTALAKLQSYAAKYPWVINIDWDKAVESIHNAMDRGMGYVVDESYLVMVDEVVPWYSEDRILQEWLVIRIYPGGDIDSVPPALVEMAKDRDCIMVMSADSSPVKLVADAYVRADFLPLTQTFYQRV